MSLVSSIAAGILWFIGWSVPPDEYLETMEDRAVILFSHSSYWDFVLFLLYWLCYPQIMRKTYIVMKPQPFKHFSWLLEPTFVPATRLEDRGKGFVKTMVERFRTQDSFRLMLSPKGTIVQAPWRSGYYHIAYQLQAKIQVLGLDYQDKTIVICPAREIDEQETLEENLKNDMSLIAPLYPSQELHPTPCLPSLLTINPFALMVSLILLLEVAMLS